MKKRYLFGLLILLLPVLVFGQINPKGIAPESNVQPKATGSSNAGNAIQQSPKATQPANVSQRGQARSRPRSSPKKVIKRRAYSSADTTYWNEWINYSLKYYKIKVANDGIYRIDSLALAKAGLNVATNDSRHYKLFYRGQEQYIYVSAQSPTNFSEVKGNYIEFYGLHNDGVLDSSVYTNIFFVPNPYYSLYNDTSTYYLTYDPSYPGKRMTEVDSTRFSSYQMLPYFMTSTVNQQNFQYMAGARYIDGGFTVNDPRFTQSTCWTNIEIGYNSGVPYAPNVYSVYTGAGAPNAFIRTVFMGTDMCYNKNVSIFSNYGPLLSNIAFNGFTVIDTTISIPASNVNVSHYTVTYSVNATANDSSTMAVSYLYVDYPHTMNLYTSYEATTFTMDVPDGTGMAYLSMFNFKASHSDTVRFYDLTNHRRFVATDTAGYYNVLVPNSGGYKHCFLTSDSVIKTSIFEVKNLIPVGHNANGIFQNFTGESGNYLIITHPKLWTQSSLYAGYRSTAAGGGFTPILADINEIYDQFGYGVDYSPIGIRNLCNYALNKWTIKPEYLFLIGKGIHTPLFRAHDSTYLDSLVLVPSWGYPSSDILLTNGLGNSSGLEPGIPTGRIAAINEQEVADYLYKVGQYEAWAPSLWQKKVAHFAGGADLSEETLFASFLNTYASFITVPYFGADIYNFSKSSPNPITITLSDSITNLINGGVSLMTFFGHASGNDFDFSLDYPSDYQNGTRYPFIIANACFSGDIYQPVGAIGNVSSVSEQWVLEQPGAIGFLASDYVADDGVLDRYTQRVYQCLDSSHVYPETMGSMGRIIQNTIESIGTTTLNTLTYLCLEMTLHGDPAISICQYDTLPDYAVTDSSIYFTPANITAELDSFNVNVIVSNYAEALNQPVNVAVTRYFPNGSDTVYQRVFNHIYFQDTVVIRMGVNHIIGLGLNKFCVDANPSRFDTEVTYTNNNICNIPLNIISGDIVPVWPYDYAIIPAPFDTVMLKASTGDPFAPSRKYLFEIDTTDLFNSSWGMNQVVTKSGGVVCAISADWANGLPHRPDEKLPVTKVNTGIEEMNAARQKTTAMQQGSEMPKPSSNAKVTIQSPEMKPEVQAPVKPSGNMKAQAVAVNGKTSAKNISPLKETGVENKTEHRSHAPSKLNLKPGQVYYWRVRRDTVNGSGLQTDLKDYPWMVSSFQYLKGYTGWGQSAYYQFLDDEIYQDSYNFIDTTVKNKQWYFSLAGKQLQCNTFGTLDENVTKLYATDYTINDFVYAYAGCIVNPGINVAIIDPVSLVPWNTANYRYGNVNYYSGSNPFGCGNQANQFIYWYNSFSQMDSLKVFLRDKVPSNFYILVWSYMDGFYKLPDLPDTSLIGEFQALGSRQMEYHKKTPGLDSVPFIFFVQKGNPASAREVYGRNAIDSLQFTTVLKTNGTYGSIVTPLIGPAAKYDSLSWYQHPYNHSTTDSARLNIFGITSGGTVKPLIGDIPPSVANMYISSINATMYPYIQLEIYTKDTGKHAPSQMNWWRVFYTPVPELAVNPNFFTYYHSDTLQVGDTLRLQTVVQNISDYTMDTTVLHTWVMDQHYNTAYSNYSKIKKLVPGDTALLSMKWYPTNSYIGNNSVWFEVNPLALPQTQLEQYHFNNIAERTFNSFGDKINPLLDVTFDGIHILNNDIVSPTPNILITVMDENKFLALNNPNDVRVYLQNLTTNSLITQLTYGPTLSFTPATEPHNKCSLLYTPTLADGTYELTVQATDISGNLSAINSYKIDFQVINKPMITEVMNYPNPFSTSTRFVFILTGDQIPTTFKIQVMTVTGKIIKEITEAELGPIHIGRNITQYAWDGTDQYGGKLANGVYLYRVIASIDGQSIDEYQGDYNGAQTSTLNQYFTKNWGKMYILR